MTKKTTLFTGFLFISVSLFSQTYLELNTGSKDISSDIVRYSVVDFLDLRPGDKSHIGTIETSNGLSEIYYQGNLRDYFLSKLSSPDIAERDIPTPVGNGLIIVLRDLDIKKRGRESQISAVIEFFTKVEDNYLKIDDFTGKESSFVMESLPLKIMEKALSNISANDFNDALFTGYYMTPKDFNHYKERAHEMVTISNSFPDGIYRFFNDIYFNPQTTPYKKRLLDHLSKYTGDYLQIGKWEQGRILLDDGLYLNGKIWGYVVNSRIYYRVHENNFVQLTKYSNHLIYNFSRQHSHIPTVYVFGNNMAATFLVTTAVEGIRKQKKKKSDRNVYFLEYIYGTFREEVVE